MRTNRPKWDHFDRTMPSNTALEANLDAMQSEATAAELLPDAEADLLAMVGADELESFRSENRWHMRNFREKYMLTEQRISQEYEDRECLCNGFNRDGCDACRPEPWDGETELEF